MSSTDILVIIAQQILIYGGIFMIIFGMFGSLMIIIIFIRRPFNENSCSLYIIANGIISLIFLPIFFLPNIVTFGLQINWLALNTPWCKFQMSYGSFTVTSVFIINCLISFDRYAMCSQSVRIRSLSSKKMSRILLFLGLLFVWCFIGIPVAILFENVSIDTNNSVICTSKSKIFLAIAALIYYPIIEGLLPIILVILFWFLTRKHVHRLHNQYLIKRFDKQITRMCFYQIIIYAIASFPFATINLYRAATNETIRSENHENIIQFIRILAICLFYIQYCCDYYIYLIISSDIREQTKRILYFWYYCRNNRIEVASIPLPTSKNNQAITPRFIL